MSSTLIRGGTIVSADSMQQADVYVENGLIKDIGSGLSSAEQEIDASGKLLFPQLIDCHVHCREPGLTHKSTLASEAKAAYHGGIGAMCEMPNTIPPTVTVEALRDKVLRLQSIPECDIRFFFGVTEAEHLEELRTLLTSSAPDITSLRSFMCGVKLYLDHSTGNQKIQEHLIEHVFTLCAEHDVMVVAHCEDPAMNDAAKAANQRTDVAAHSVCRPPESEEVSVLRTIQLVSRLGAKFHVAHVSTAGALKCVREAKENGERVSCEVSPHHLWFSTDDYERLGTLGKMNPPLRSKDHQSALWAGLHDGTVDCIATDHAPHTLQEKQDGPPLSAPSGVPGLDTMFPLLLTAAAEERITYSDIARLCFDNPNRLFQLDKKNIAVGNEATIVLVDPKAQWTFTEDHLHTKCGWSPFMGMEMKGRIEELRIGK